MKKKKFGYCSARLFAIGVVFSLLGCVGEGDGPVMTVEPSGNDAHKPLSTPIDGEGSKTPPALARPALQNAAPSLPVSDKGPNVILLLVDTLRADRLGCYGHKVDTSPGIDAFAKEAVLFEHAYAAAPWTLPSVASIMTGRYPSVMGITDDLVILDEKFTSIAEMLHANGYYTGSIISHHLVGKQYNMHRGFEFYNDDNIQKSSIHISSQGVTDVGIQFLNDLKGDKPFFLYMHYFDPHYKYVMHAILDTYPGFNGLLEPRMSIHHLRMLAEKGFFTEDDLKYLSALYDSEVRYTDYHIERFLNELRRLGLYDNSLIIFVADHGEELAERSDAWIGHSRKMTEEQIHVPLIIKLPEMKEGRQIADPVSLVDIYPTIAELTGATGADHIDGVPLDLSGSGKGRKYVYSETFRWANRQAVISGEWKLVHDDNKKKNELFNLTKDPYTHTDLSKVKKELVDELSKERDVFAEGIQHTIAKMGVVFKRPEISQDEQTRLFHLGYIRHH